MSDEYLREHWIIIPCFLLVVLVLFVIANLAMDAAGEILRKACFEATLKALKGLSRWLGRDLVTPFKELWGLED
jgi:hypothetical protein